MTELSASKGGHATCSTCGGDQHGRNAIDVTGITANIVGYGNVYRRQTRDTLRCYTGKGTRNDIGPVTTGTVTGDAAVAERAVGKVGPIGGIRRYVAVFAAERAHRYMVDSRGFERRLGNGACKRRSIGSAMALRTIVRG